MRAVDEPHDGTAPAPPPDASSVTPPPGASPGAPASDHPGPGGASSGLPAAEGASSGLPAAEGASSGLPAPAGPSSGFPAPAGPASDGSAPSPAPAGSESRKARLLRWWRSPPLRWTVAIVVLIFIAEYLLLPDIANARKSLNLLGKVNVWGLIFGVVLEAVALLAYAELTRTVLSPDPPRRSLLFRVNMSSLAVSHVVPGGTAPGTAVAYRLLTERGVPSGLAAFGLATQGVGSAVVLNAIFWLALLISIPLRGYNPLYGFAAIAGLILFVLFAGTVLLLTRGQHHAADRLHGWAAKLPLVNPDRVSALVQTIADRLQILLRDRALLTHATEWAAANWLFDAASLWVFIFAFGKAVSPIDLLVAYGLANILAVIPITPGGLGVVEGVLIPTLVGFHVHKTIAILGVLSYRLVNFWLPIPLGGAAYLSLRLEPAARTARKERGRHGRTRARRAGRHHTGSHTSP